MGRPRAVLAALVAALLVAPAAARADDPQLLSQTQLTPRLQQLEFRTSALAAPTGVRVLLPPGYDPSGATRYPELLLLHGAGDDEAAWTTKGDAENITKDWPGIVVMPDGGTFGLYTDWFSGTQRYESFHIGQLQPWIDAHYPTVGTRAGRAIAGLSMGGGGAMTYAAKHPDMFVAAASFSGQLDTNYAPSQGLIGTAAVLNGTPGEPFGSRATQEVRWRGQNATDLAENLSNTDVTVRTGNGQPGGGAPGELLPDPLEMAVHEESLSFHAALQRLGISSTFEDYGKGTHTWFYWQRDLRELLPALSKVFAEKRPDPATFTYTTIAPSYDVYGWHVDVRRPALEFSTLRDAGAGGFTLQGSGSAHVVTGPVYTPGQSLALVVGSSDNARGRTVTADASGRLSVDVDLGPGNPYQEYSPAAAAWMARGAAKNGISLSDLSKFPVYTAKVAIEPVSAASGGGARRCRRVARIALRGVRSRDVRRVVVSVGGRKRRALYGPRSAVRVTLARRSRVRVRITLRGGRVRSLSRTLRGTRVCTSS